MTSNRNYGIVDIKKGYDMGLIEYYGNQMDNLIDLEINTIWAYKKVVPHACHCGKHEYDYVTDFGEWHPVTDYNHTWQIVTLLENFGYTGYDYDTVFYTFYLQVPECAKHGELRYEGDGLNFGQAVCNTLIKFANDYKFTE